MALCLIIAFVVADRNNLTPCHNLVCAHLSAARNVLLVMVLVFSLHCRTASLKESRWEASGHQAVKTLEQGYIVVQLNIDCNAL